MSTKDQSDLVKLAQIKLALRADEPIRVEIGGVGFVVHGPGDQRFDPALYAEMKSLLLRSVRNDELVVKGTETGFKK